MTLRLWGLTWFTVGFRDGYFLHVCYDNEIYMNKNENFKKINYLKKIINIGVYVAQAMNMHQQYNFIL